jgi:hypothetical protein
VLTFALRKSRWRRETSEGVSIGVILLCVRRRSCGHLKGARSRSVGVDISAD